MSKARAPKPCMRTTTTACVLTSMSAARTAWLFLAFSVTMTSGWNVPFPKFK